MSPEHVTARVLAAQNDPLAGARRLRAREQAGERLSPVQREFWRRALAREMQAEEARRERDGSAA